MFSRSPRLAALPAASIVLAFPALAQEPTPVLEEGDTVTGVGLVTSVSNMAVNDGGSWIVEVDTDNANTDIDGALVKDGALLFQEGQAIAPAVLLDSFDSVTINANGDSAYNFFLDGTTGLSDDSGLYFNDTLILQESFVSTAAGFGTGTPYIGFFEVKVNDSGDVLVMASVDDPGIASSVDRALVVLTTDGAGNLVSETVLFKEGDVLPGQVEAVTDFRTGPHNFAFNNNGDVMFGADLEGDSTVDDVVYLNGTLLAQEGGASPVTGRTWATITSPELSLNDNGDYVFSGILDGDAASDNLIEKNGAKFRQEGDSLPDIAPFTLTSFGSGPLLIDADGDVLWFGDWDDTDTDVDTGLFLNDTLIVQEGVTTVGGVLVDSLSGVQDGYAMSPDGTYILFEATLADGTNGAYRLVVAKTEAIASCAGNPGTLAVTSGSPAIGTTMTFEMDNGPAVNSVGLLGISNKVIATYPPCGVFVPAFGEFLIDLTPPNPLVLKVFPTVWTGAPIMVDQTFPNKLSLVGKTFAAQGVFVLPPAPVTYSLTDGILLTFGNL